MYGVWSGLVINVAPQLIYHLVQPENYSCWAPRKLNTSESHEHFYTDALGHAEHESQLIFNITVIKNILKIFSKKNEIQEILTLFSLPSHHIHYYYNYYNYYKRSGQVIRVILIHIYVYRTTFLEGTNTKDPEDKRPQQLYILISVT